MRTKKGVLTFLLFAGIMLFTAQSAFGGCEVAAMDQLIDLSDNAPGTKYSGTLTVYFHPNEAGMTGDMYLFARLRKGIDLYAFSDVIGGVTHEDFMNDPILVGDFFLDTVIPYLYDCVFPNCPDAVLKSYDMDVSHDGQGEFNLMQFYVVDFTIAVHD